MYSMVSYKFGQVITLYIILAYLSFNLNCVVGLFDKELVASKKVLEEIFNEKELVLMYRANLEFEKSKNEQRKMGGSSSVLSPPIDEEGLVVFFFMEYINISNLFSDKLNLILSSSCLFSKWIPRLKESG